MDSDDEMKRFKGLLVVGIIFAVSTYFSWQEFKYILFGKTVDARLVDVYQSEERGRRGRTREVLAVEYQFTDADGSTRKEKDTISIKSKRPPGPTVAVQYLSNSPGYSRLSGHNQRIWLLAFFGCLAYIVYKILQILREAKR